VLIGIRAVRQGVLEQPRIEVRDAEYLEELTHSGQEEIQSTWRRSPRGPYSPHVGQAWCGITLLSHAGLTQSTIDVVVVFHADRR
jgi:predicted class III extradiol MEMO1 family dioxygenase